MSEELLNKIWEVLTNGSFQKCCSKNNVTTEKELQKIFNNFAEKKELACYWKRPEGINGGNIIFEQSKRHDGCFSNDKNKKNVHFFLDTANLTLYCHVSLYRRVD